MDDRSELTRWVGRAGRAASSVPAGEGEGIESSHVRPAHLAAATAAANARSDAVAMATVWSDVIPTRLNHWLLGVVEFGR